MNFEQKKTSDVNYSNIRFDLLQNVIITQKFDLRLFSSVSGNEALDIKYVGAFYIWMMISNVSISVIIIDTETKYFFEIRLVKTNRICTDIFSKSDRVNIFGNFSIKIKLHIEFWL